MPSGMMQSKAEIRSVGTIKKQSPRSNISRTLPLLIFFIPGRSRLSKGADGDDCGLDFVLSMLSLSSRIQEYGRVLYCIDARASSHWFGKVKAKQGNGSPSHSVPWLPTRQRERGGL